MKTMKISAKRNIMILQLETISGMKWKCLKLRILWCI